MNRGITRWFGWAVVAAAVLALPAIGHADGQTEQVDEVLVGGSFSVDLPGAPVASENIQSVSGLMMLSEVLLEIRTADRRIGVGAEERPGMLEPGESLQKLHGVAPCYNC